MVHRNGLSRLALQGIALHFPGGNGCGLHPGTILTIGVQFLAGVGVNAAHGYRRGLIAVQQFVVFFFAQHFEAVAANITFRAFIADRIPGVGVIGNLHLSIGVNIHALLHVGKQRPGVRAGLLAQVQCLLGGNAVSVQFPKHRHAVFRLGGLFGFTGLFRFRRLLGLRGLLGLTGLLRLTVLFFHNKGYRIGRKRSILIHMDGHGAFTGQGVLRHQTGVREQVVIAGLELLTGGPNHVFTAYIVDLHPGALGLHIGFLKLEGDRVRRGNAVLTHTHSLALTFHQLIALGCKARVGRQRGFTGHYFHKVAA